MIESRLATVDRCFDLVSTRLVGQWLTKKHMVMTSNETQIYMLADWSTSHAKLVTPNNRQTSEYHVVDAIKRLRTDKNCHAENTRSTMLEKMKVSRFCTAAMLYGRNNRFFFLWKKKFLSYAKYFHCSCHATWLPCKPRTRKSASDVFAQKKFSEDIFDCEIQICPELQVNEINGLYDKHHQVCSFLKSHQKSNMKMTLCDAYS